LLLFPSYKSNNLIAIYLKYQGKKAIKEDVYGYSGSIHVY
jgi:hypothetical protein